MIRHVVVWKIAEDLLSEGESPAELAGKLSAELNALESKIPGVAALTAGPNCVDAEGNWDFGLVADFENQEDLDTYANHPLHMAVVMKIRAIVSARACVDFEV